MEMVNPSSSSAMELFITKAGEIRQLQSAEDSLPNTLARHDDAGYGARLCLSEGLNESAERSLRRLELDVPPSFSETHYRDTVSMPETCTYPETVFHVKWTAQAMQTARQWEIEQKIESRKPYDVDTIRDPLDLRLTHTRYERSPAFPYRPYHPISITDNRHELVHAAFECASFYFKRAHGVTTGFLLFDPPRFHQITRKKYEFWFDSDGPDTTANEHVFLGHRSSRDRFLERLGQLSPCLLQEDVAATIKNILLEMVLEDELSVLATINAGLDHVDLSLARDGLLWRAVDTWRDRFGRWRYLLVHKRNSVGFLCSQSNLSGPYAEGDTRAHEHRRNSLATRMAQLQLGLQGTSGRIDDTFQAFMSTMSIVESARAIKEAETVTKLTHLAFFFVPLTLVTTAFGTNIIEFEERLTCWQWLVTSAIVVLLTYVSLYRRQIVRFFVRAPGRLTDMSFSRLSKLAIRWLTIAKSTWRAAPFVLTFVLWLGLNVGIVTGLWKLIESPLSLGAKTGISLAILSGYLVAALVPPIRRYRRRRDSASATIVLGSLVVGVAMLAATGTGMWKLLDSELPTGGKTIASFAILIYSTLMSMVPTFLTRRSRTRTPSLTPDFSSV